MRYRIELTPGPGGNIPPLEVIEAHQVDCSPAGALLFFDDGRYMLRAFAPGMWLSLTLMPEVTVGVTVVNDRYSDATKAAVAGG